MIQKQLAAETHSFLTILRQFLRDETRSTNFFFVHFYTCVYNAIKCCTAHAVYHILLSNEQIIIYLEICPSVNPPPNTVDVDSVKIKNIMFIFQTSLNLHCYAIPIRLSYNEALIIFIIVTLLLFYVPTQIVFSLTQRILYDTIIRTHMQDTGRRSDPFHCMLRL